MATTTVYADYTDGLIMSEHAVYATARAGGTLTALFGYDGYDLWVGQRNMVTKYVCYESFVAFDFSSKPISDDVANAAVLSFFLYADLTTTDFTLEARACNWGTSLATDDYVAGADLGSLLLLASKTVAPAGGYNDLSSEPGFAASLSTDGVNRLILCSDRHRVGTTPAGSEACAWCSASEDGTTLDPKLVVTHTPPPSGYYVEVGWTPDTSGLFTIGSSTVGGTDALGGFYGTYTWTDISAQVRAVTITRGRTDDTQHMLPSQAMIELVDPDGDFNPHDAAGDYYGYVQPMRPIRVKVVRGATTYYLFTGYIQTIESQPTSQQGYRVGIVACDAFCMFERTYPVLPRLPGVTSGEAIGSILDLSDWPSGDRDLGGGRNVNFFESSGGESSLSQLTELTEYDGGIFYIDGDGDAIFQDYTTTWLSDDSTIDSHALDLTLIRDVSHIYNEVRIGQGPYVMRDAASQALFGVRGYPVHFNDEWQHYLGCLFRGMQILTTCAQPRTRARVRMTSADTDAVTAMLSRDLWDRVRIYETPAGATGSYRIEAITHSISDAGKVHECEWYLTRLS